MEIAFISPLNVLGVVIKKKKLYNGLVEGKKNRSLQPDCIQVIIWLDGFMPIFARAGEAQLSVLDRQ